MTQFLAKCLNCGGLVSHLEESATVDRCSACKGNKRLGEQLRAEKGK